MIGSIIGRIISLVVGLVALRIIDGLCTASIFIVSAILSLICSGILSFDDAAFKRPGRWPINGLYLEITTNAPGLLPITHALSPNYYSPLPSAKNNFSFSWDQ